MVKPRKQSEQAAESTSQEAPVTSRRASAKVGAGRQQKPETNPKPVRKRREQQRAIDTKQTILNAALSEFAQLGYEAASIRTIAATTGLQHPLITYHYQTKEILWKAVALNAFNEIRQLWDESSSDQESLPPLDHLRLEYSTFLRFTLTHPDFHHFMLRESRPDNPRLPWLVETILRPTMQRLLPQIENAQARGELPAADPALIHYLMIGVTSVLSSLRDEIGQSAGIAVDDPSVVEQYIDLVDALIFHPARSSGQTCPSEGTHRPSAEPA